MSNLKIVTNPNPILRRKSDKILIKTTKTKEFQKLLNDMADLMAISDGVGLAAPQVGLNIRLVIVQTKDGILALINPKITKKSLAKEWGEEGCLSVPNTFGQVKRSKKIRCKFLDKDHRERMIDAEGLMARVIQHEVDHLDGVLFIDKAKDIVQEN